MKPLTWVTVGLFLVAIAAREFGAPREAGWAIVALSAVLLALGVRSLLRLRRDGGMA